MIVATLPEPTVGPPSRFSVDEIGVILCGFQDFFGTCFFEMHLVSEVLQILPNHCLGNLLFEKLFLSSSDKFAAIR